MDIEQSKEYLKKGFAPEYHSYIDNKLAGDFAVVMADDRCKIVGRLVLLIGEADISLQAITDLEQDLDALRDPD